MLDELVKKELSEEEITEIKLEEIIKYITLIKKSKTFVSSEIRKEELKFLSELAESLFELRLSKVLEGKVGKGFDEFIFDIFKILKQFYVDLLTGRYIIYNDKIYCIVQKPLIYNDHRVNEGDVLVLPMREALPLIIASYLTPYKIDIEEQL
ncbi:hypothetical protein SULI_10345 [Saccharolobus solfataricus]|uniref:DNA replication complex GINS protein Gins15 n=3 Tax=Saccharolobus solfataricus TaxID=2287 RepID=GIN15_SACS2|nr:hypothetical protein [Saccharolobus solfataricus]AAK41311.1 Hypothetical protein SSO1049 [Saccharolobus solfataricus P2]AKA74258.1 hypothetical protein SULB_2054 [Saccharolobus solfataricus]AKA76955.1 hypothetical protein SULC_2052 [Saccharolobus solfataricus]AKA79647.1 hypothetical protein SULA_2053 [Saccharolobus solfataricus]AZF68739.1 hypothetical protein SULG_10345 [Saccharolobus solfataricus]